jgi:hypothetical protein
VCRQWNRVACSPALLEHLEIGGQNEQWAAPRLESLCAWLVHRRPAQHAATFWLTLELDVPGDAAREEASKETSRLVTACLATVGATAGASLQDMYVVANNAAPLSAAGWPAGLAALTSLTLINYEGRVQLGDSLRSLVGLRHMKLLGHRIEWRATGAAASAMPLPRGLTRLEWALGEDCRLPQEVGGRCAARGCCLLA